MPTEETTSINCNFTNYGQRRSFAAATVLVHTESHLQPEHKPSLERLGGLAHIDRKSWPSCTQIRAKMSVMDRMMLTRSFMLYASSDVLEFCHWSLKQSTNLSTLGFILSTQRLPVELSVTLGEISCTCM